MLVFGKHRMELSGGYRITTSSRMELMAVLRGLEALHERCKAEVYTGSKYVVDVLSKGRVAKWRDNGWQRNDGGPVINPDLLGELLEVCESHEVTFLWLGEPTGNPEHERCKQLGADAAKLPDLPADKPLAGTVHSPPASGIAPSLPDGHKGRLRKAVTRVRRDLNPPYDNRTENAVRRAGREKLTELGPDLLQVMQSATTPSLRGWCAWALGKLIYHEAEVSLIAALSDRSREVRKWAAWALGEIGNFRTEAHLRRALDHESQGDVRQAIGGALKKLNHDSTRIHESQLIGALRPPETHDPKLKALMDRLQQLEGAAGSAEIVAMRAAMKSHDPSFFKSYMSWLKRKPGLLAALQDDKKVFRD